jgi:hypothetical protein
MQCECTSPDCLSKTLNAQGELTSTSLIAMFGLARVKAAFTMQYAGRNVYLAHKQTMTAVELRFTDAEALGLWIHWPTFFQTTRPLCKHWHSLDLIRACYIFRDIFTVLDEEKYEDNLCYFYSEKFHLGIPFDPWNFMEVIVVMRVRDWNFERIEEIQERIKGDDQDHQAVACAA